MTEDPTWNPPKPTAADLELLERIADERAAIAAVAADRLDGALRRHLLSALDRMEEALCVHGHLLAEGDLAAGWQELAGWEDRLGEGAAGDGRARSRRQRRRRAVRRAAAPRKAVRPTPRRAG